MTDPRPPDIVPVSAPGRPADGPAAIGVDRPGPGGRSAAAQAGQALLDWAVGWWVVVHFGAQMLVLMLARSSYRGRQRRVMYQQLYLATAPSLATFVVISSLLSLVIIRIVVATAASYGLSRYALDVLVRTLVIELLPVLVALFVAVRYTMPAGEHVSTLRGQGRLLAMWRAGGDPARDELLPRVVAGVFAVTLLAALSCLLALLLTYVSVYGFTSWAFASYTRTVGQVFNPAVTLIFALKTLFFSLAVAILPLAPQPRQPPGALARKHDNVGQLGRLFAVVLVVEIFSLVGNYY